jgi:hypothetical protein
MLDSSRLSSNLILITIGAIIDSLLFFAQVVDLVLPSTSSTSHLLSMLDFQMAGTSTTGICLWEMDGVGKILMGYYLPGLLLLCWLLVALISRTHQWITSVNQPHDDGPLLMENAQPPNNNINSIINSGLQLDRCCNNRLPIPSISLMLLHISLIAYSSIVKSTLSLLQCHQSPTDPSKTIMFLAGRFLSCHRRVSY